MNRRNVFALAVVSVAFLGGCRFKGGESFTSATTPHVSEPGQWKGDPYASGGIADATGGLKPSTQLQDRVPGAGTDKIDPTYNRPAYGSGQRRGDVGSQAAPGHGFSNAPVHQAGPNTGPSGNP